MKRRTNVRTRWAAFEKRLEKIEPEHLTVGALLWALEAAGPIRVTIDHAAHRFGIVPVYGREVPEDLLPAAQYFAERTRPATRERQRVSAELADRAVAMKRSGMRWRDIEAALDRDSTTLQRAIKRRASSGDRETS